MTAKLLQLVNSAFFGVRREVASPLQAVQLLGLDTVRALALTVHASRRLRAVGADPPPLARNECGTTRCPRVASRGRWPPPSTVTRR